jgi:putative salt-induced outer membrane protein YdiY
MHANTFLIATAISFSTISAASAQAKPDGQWHGAAGAGLSIASGNTSSSALSVTADTVKETAEDKITGYGLLLRAQSKVANVSTKTSDLFKLGGRYDRNLTDKIFAFGGGELERNQLQNLSLRTSLNGGLGYKVIRTPETAFDVFAGLGWSQYNYTGTALDKSGVEALIGEESVHKLSPTVSFKQRVVVYPGLQSGLGIRATMDAGLSAAIAGNLTANVTLSNRYQSKHAVGSKANDLLLLVGVGYKF